jgi:CBS-domain-containing membrane protein
VCMAATLGGTMRAPLTAVVFAFGLTHDAAAILPILLGSAVAYGFTVVVMPRSILTEKIARRGRHVFREYGVDPLERHFVEEVMTREVVTIAADLPVAAALDRYFGADQRQRAYPVVADGRLVGMLDRERLRGVAAGMSATDVGSLFAERAAACAAPGETCRAVASRMAAHALERLPVVDAATHCVIGIVSRSDLLKPAGDLHDEETRRERFL